MSNFFFTYLNAPRVNYNIRSWVTNIKNDKFIQDLTYTYGGNIREYKWGIENEMQSYYYQYDQLSRLLIAKHTNLKDMTGIYSSAYTYDKHGNITTIKRYGNKTLYEAALVDNLALGYTGNQLTNIVDSGVDGLIEGSADFKNYIDQDIE